MRQVQLQWHRTTCSPLPDPAAAVHAVTANLNQAAHSAQQASHALDTAHQHLAHLTADPIT